MRSVLLLLLAVPSLAAAQSLSVSGVLEDGDEVLRTDSGIGGMFIDRHELAVEAGDLVEVTYRLTSGASPLLRVSTPSGQRVARERCGDATCVLFVAGEGGPVRLGASSFSTGDHAYELAARALRPGDASRRERDRDAIEPSDPEDGRSYRYDDHTIRADAGQILAVQLDSGDFLLEMTLLDPDGYRVEMPGEGSPMARLAQRATKSGVYTVRVRPNYRGETGAYEIDMAVYD